MYKKGLVGGITGIGVVGAALGLGYILDNSSSSPKISYPMPQLSTSYKEDNNPLYVDLNKVTVRNYGSVTAQMPDKVDIRPVLETLEKIISVSTQDENSVLDLTPLTQGRLSDLKSYLKGNRGVNNSLSHLENSVCDGRNALDYLDDIDESKLVYDEYFLALGSGETHGRFNLTSVDGAIGWGQIMPFWAPFCGLENPNQLFDACVNIKCMKKIMEHNRDTYNLDDEVEMIAVWNGGSKALQTSPVPVSCLGNRRFECTDLSLYDETRSLKQRTIKNLIDIYTARIRQENDSFDHDFDDLSKSFVPLLSMNGKTTLTLPELDLVYTSSDNGGRFMTPQTYFESLIFGGIVIKESIGDEMFCNQSPDFKDNIYEALSAYNWINETFVEIHDLEGKLEKLSCEGYVITG